MNSPAATSHLYRCGSSQQAQLTVTYNWISDSFVKKISSQGIGASQVWGRETPHVKNRLPQLLWH